VLGHDVPHEPSLDEKKAQSVVDEIQAAGGDAIAVGGDVGADDFSAKIVDATIKCAPSLSFYGSVLTLRRRYGKLNHIVNNGAFHLVSPSLPIVVIDTAYESRLHI